MTVALHTPMNASLTRWSRVTLFLFAIITASLALLFFAGYIGSSATRIEKEHCVSVPLSASKIQCEPWFAISIFLDGGGTASFEMARDDLPGFLSQFQSLHSIPTPNDLTDWQNNYTVPEHFGHKFYTFNGGSRDGNLLHVDVYDVDISKVGVWIGTISN